MFASDSEKYPIFVCGCCVQQPQGQIQNGCSLTPYARGEHKALAEDATKNSISTDYMHTRLTMDNVSNDFVKEEDS